MFLEKRKEGWRNRVGGGGRRECFYVLLFAQEVCASGVFVCARLSVRACGCRSPACVCVCVCVQFFKVFVSQVGSLLFLEHAFDSRLGSGSRGELLAWPASGGPRAECRITSRRPGGGPGALARPSPGPLPSEPLARFRCLLSRSLPRPSLRISKSRWGQTRLPCLPPRLPPQPQPPQPQPPGPH